jgi:hypothetical protein
VRQDTSDRYYEEAKESLDNTLRKPISDRDAQGCWGGAMRTSENATSTHLGE